jgi:hypothetical protein
MNYRSWSVLTSFSLSLEQLVDQVRDAGAVFESGKLVERADQSGSPTGPEPIGADRDAA